MRIAVIGGGISGNLAARLLSEHHDIELFEAASHLGGHAQTVEIDMAAGPGRTESYAVDVGFMVYNERTYPNFTRMLKWLGIESRATEMSFSVRQARTGLEYQGSSLNGLFAQRTNLFRPSFYRMLADIARFNRVGRQVAGQIRVDREPDRRVGNPMAAGSADAKQTVGEFLTEHRFSRELVDCYLTPMAAAIWSCPPGKLLDFPVQFLLQFFENHGLMQLRDRPEWKTVVGGSRRYVSELLKPLRDHLHPNCPIARVERLAGGVRLVTEQGEEATFDAVVMATHADQTLRILADPDPEERFVLESFPYEPNEAVLHTDVNILPRHRRAWAAWNYHLPDRADAPATVTYNLSRLQGINSPQPILLTLNAAEEIAAEKIHRRFQFQHPAYGPDSLSAQSQWERISGRGGVYYCGAYWGYGFHEDGVKSALAVVGQIEKGPIQRGGNTCRAASIAERFSISGSLP
jgi:uncharacterized protein